MESELRAFLSRYIGQGELKKDKVQQDDVDMLVFAAVGDHVEQEIIDYGTTHPDASFWDFLNLTKDGLHGVTQEELLAEDEED